MEQVSCKDKPKAEGGPIKRRLSVTFSGFLPHFPRWKCFFPLFCMNCILLNGENGTKKCYDPNTGGDCLVTCFT
jgi:hypothetical protein